MNPEPTHLTVTVPDSTTTTDAETRWHEYAAENGYRLVGTLTTHQSACCPGYAVEGRVTRR